MNPENNYLKVVTKPLGRVIDTIYGIPFRTCEQGFLKIGATKRTAALAAVLVVGGVDIAKIDVIAYGLGKMEQVYDSWQGEAQYRKMMIQEYSPLEQVVNFAAFVEKREDAD